MSEQVKSRRVERLYSGGAPCHTNDWRHLCKKYDRRCLACRRQMPIEKLTRDHIIPVGLPGARNQVENLQPLCKDCNTKKGRRVIDFRSDLSSILQACEREWRPLTSQNITARGIPVLQPKGKPATKIGSVQPRPPQKGETTESLRLEISILGRRVHALNRKLAEKRMECHKLRSTPRRNEFHQRRKRKKKAGFWTPG